MEKTTEKPSAQAKALSLFLMAYKTKDNAYKEKSKRINRLYDLVKTNELEKEEYAKEVDNMLDLYGGYEAVIEKTIQYYLDKTGEWKSRGEDQYAEDAKKIAKKMGVK
jgi:hypothetical protein